LSAQNQIAKDQYVVTATTHGLVKKTPLSEFTNIKSNGLIAIDLRDNDELQSVRLTSGDDHVLLVTKEGQAIRFSEKDIRPTGRDTQGVKGLTMKKGDEAVMMVTFPSVPVKAEDRRRKFFLELLAVTARGIGKRTGVGEYPVQNRGGQGVKVANLNDKTGRLVAALLVTQDDEFVVITTDDAQVIKLPLKNIPTLRRPSQGVILVRLDKQDSVAAVTTIKKEED
jgi:DNA gyrase subunit A